MLKDFNRFCKQQKIRYSLSSGTLLGAIRHNGFIPWDDDLDIMVDRKNFTNLLESIDKFEGYTMHRRLWIYRIQRETEYGKNEPIPTIDVFVIDNCPDGKAARQLKILLIQIMQGMMHKKIEFGKHSIVMEVLLIITYLLGKVCNDDLKYKMYNRVSQISNQKHTKYVASYNDLFKLISVKYNNKLMNKLVLHQFEDMQAPITRFYEDYLKAQYGDYTILPKEKDRIPIHLNR